MYKLWDVTKVERYLFETLIQKILFKVLGFLLNYVSLGHGLCLIKFLWWDHNGFKKYNESCCGM